MVVLLDPLNKISEMKFKMNSERLKGFKKEKGVAGLSILLSVVAMVFIIGFLVMVFTLFGSNLADSTSVARQTTTSFTTSLTDTVVNSTALTSVSGVDPVLRYCALTITEARNQTGEALITAGNYTIDGCYLTATKLVDGAFNNSIWNVTGSFTYLANTTAQETIVDTTSALSGVVGWFPIIITISVMVSLILLTVIIIVAIRGSGLLVGSGNSGRSDASITA